MEKLKSFSFNNLRWQYRKFPYLEIKDGIKAGYLSSSWLDVFARTIGESYNLEICKANLCRMLGITAADTTSPASGEWVECVEFRLTRVHFVDAALRGRKIPVSSSPTSAIPTRINGPASS